MQNLLFGTIVKITLREKIEYICQGRERRGRRGNKQNFSYKVTTTKFRNENFYMKSLSL